MKTITTRELARRLFNMRGAAMTTIVANTEQKLTGGKSCPLKGLRKISRVNGVINWSYEAAVNRQRLREGTPCDEQGQVEGFIPDPRAWGRRLYEQLSQKKRLTPLVAHPWKDGFATEQELESIPVDRLYLEFKVQKSLEHEYYFGDKKVPEDEVKPWMPEKQEGARQQVENPVILRDYKIINIKQITLDGEIYEVV